MSPEIYQKPYHNLAVSSENRYIADTNRQGLMHIPPFIVL